MSKTVKRVSKTVKRVSKTVKRVMTVMMIGLVAMLGAKAEAHYIVFKGQCFWHSGECVRKDDPPDPPIPDPAVTDPPEVELVARVTRVDILCPGNIVEAVDLSLNPVTLITGPEPIVQGDITTAQRGGIISTNLEVRRIVSDALFLENPADLKFCSGSIPKDMMIREMSPVQMNLYCFDADCPDDLAVPPNPVVHSAWTAQTCTLSDKFNFTNYPKNFPTRGAPFDCSGTQRCHIDDLGQKLVCFDL